MEESQVRVSCGSMCRIIIDGKYLLILNQNRRKKGYYQLSPIGGAITIDSWDYLSSLHIDPERVGSNDLRFYINAAQIEDFRAWFYSRQNREQDPFREIYEELVLESHALFDVSRRDVRMRFDRVVEDRKQTIRKGLTGQFTQYFFDIFDVSFRSQDIVLRLKTAPSDAGIVLLDEAVVKAGISLNMEFDGKMRQVNIVAEYLF
ncbi:MAG: hypothetical protein L0154_15785 [Chloroflexi bacterium]|nr:hypothetical protein [Chloroflexota bacterium]